MIHRMGATAMMLSELKEVIKIHKSKYSSSPVNFCYQISSLVATFNFKNILVCLFSKNDKLKNFMGLVKEILWSYFSYF
jgi:hypothetical protein